MERMRLLTLLTIAVFCIVLVTNSQKLGQQLRTAVLESRQVDKATGVDNYVLAAFSFEKGANGPAAVYKTRNDWDIYFYAYRQNDGKVLKDLLDVSMVVDDRSHIKDLGPLEWEALVTVPELPAYDAVTREKPVEAVVGHIYLIHTADSDSDGYTLFRVEELTSGKRAVISWMPFDPSQGVLTY